MKRSSEPEDKTKSWIPKICDSWDMWATHGNRSDMNDDKWQWTPVLGTCFDRDTSKFIIMFNLKLKGLSEPQLLFDFKLCAFGTQEVFFFGYDLFLGEQEESRIQGVSGWQGLGKRGSRVLSGRKDPQHTLFCQET